MSVISSIQNWTTEKIAKLLLATDILPYKKRLVSYLLGLVTVGINLIPAEYVGTAPVGEIAVVLGWLVGVLFAWGWAAALTRFKSE